MNFLCEEIFRILKNKTILFGRITHCMDIDIYGEIKAHWTVCIVIE
jgi:hypothetical protein